MFCPRDFPETFVMCVSVCGTGPESCDVARSESQPRELGRDQWSPGEGEAFETLGNRENTRLWEQVKKYEDLLVTREIGDL